MVLKMALYKYKVGRGILRNLEKPYGYRYYQHFMTNKGDYVIYSRDGKRYYISRTLNSELLLLPDMPFKNVTEAKAYLDRRLQFKSNLPISNKGKLELK
jgi:hypothetical protein